MIDLHSHVLFGLDDGPRTMDESIRMCWMSYREGIRTIVATPHTLNGAYQNSRPTILQKVIQLNEAIAQSGFRSSKFGVRTESRRPWGQMRELRILPGADVRFSEEILPRLDRGEVMTVADGKKFLILEFPFHAIPYRAEEVIFQLLAKGVTPILSHPERNLEIARKPDRYIAMIRMGCLGQVTAMSLTGGFGAKIKSVAQELLKRRLVHLIASDAHDLNGRPPGLLEAVIEAERIVGRREARRMVSEYPKAIVEGKRPDVLDPIPH